MSRKTMTFHDILKREMVRLASNDKRDERTPVIPSRRHRSTSSNSEDSATSSRDSIGGVIRRRNYGGITRRRPSTNWKESKGAKLVVTNLHHRVSETDVWTLFSDIGPLHNTRMHYDRHGRSLGTCEVVYEKRVDAINAIKKFHGVPLDGLKLNIQFAATESFGRSSRGYSGSRHSAQPRIYNNMSPKRSHKSDGKRKEQKESLTKEQLDAELDDYFSSVLWTES